MNRSILSSLVDVEAVGKAKALSLLCAVILFIANKGNSSEEGIVMKTV